MQDGLSVLRQSLTQPFNQAAEDPQKLTIEELDAPITPNQVRSTSAPRGGSDQPHLHYSYPQQPALLASANGAGLAHLTGSVQPPPTTTLQVLSSPSTSGGQQKQSLSQHSDQLGRKENVMPRSNFNNEDLLGLQELISMNQGIKSRFEQLKSRGSGLGYSSSVNSNKN